MKIKLAVRIGCLPETLPPLGNSKEEEKKEEEEERRRRKRATEDYGLYGHVPWCVTAGVGH